ncbi:MAG: ATP-binding protein [Desulfuromonadales bacterium]
MDTATITTLIFEWQSIILRRQGIRRDMEEPLFCSLGSRPIKIVTGFRRSGKSFLVQQVAKRLLVEERIAEQNLLYLNFEDFRLMEVTSPERLNEIFELFLSVSAKPGKKLLIFDEIQNVTNWDRFIRTIYEKEDTDTEIILTGSNSELLSSELCSNLAGRFIEFSLLPFSFSEFLAFRGAMVATVADYHRNRREINTFFSEFLKFGGLPEVFTISEADAKLSYLSGVLSKVILDDIIRRFRVDNVVLLEKIFHFLLANAGSITTFASLARQAGSLGIQTKSETIITYCSYFIKAFALFEVNRFSWKQNRVFSDTRKYYTVDTGLITLFRPSEENISSRLEQCVFLELMRRRSPPFFGTNDVGREIDFVVPSGERRHDKYQITAKLTAENEKRELGSFALADPYLQAGANLLLTLEDDENGRVWQGVQIERKNLGKWLLRL